MTQPVPGLRPGKERRLFASTGCGPPKYRACVQKQRQSKGRQIKTKKNQNQNQMTFRR